eukprot:CAMPEP_0172377724 /NCGR_PEP_ID=MMETSP1060-20121228/69060_1 /TAXON_ID=37318 /ORGANISM="Pseudo-nitzschia pungens, Strain cf. cingulata" /LENGTH=245 /DNA_ID=CAMNT_0013105433 /DNA_START=918 /DNA_END=1655 /DNA_ORIENTATION=+
MGKMFEFASSLNELRLYSIGHIDQMFSFSHADQMLYFASALNQCLTSWESFVSAHWVNVGGTFSESGCESESVSFGIWCNSDCPSMSPTILPSADPTTSSSPSISSPPSLVPNQLQSTFPSVVPSTSPSSLPSASECTNDGSFRLNGKKNQHRNWAAKKPGKHCHRKDKVTKKKVKDFCLMACDLRCVCINDKKSFYSNGKIHKCRDIKTKKLCDREASRRKGKDKGEIVADFCRKKCGTFLLNE